MDNRAITRHIFNVLRTLKAKNPGDNYYEEYLKHYKREGEDFYDQYHLAVERVIERPPARILEIGVRTGLSICNMLAAYIDFSTLKRVVLIDLWNDGFASPEIVKMNMRALNLPVTLMQNIEFFIGDSKFVVPKLEGQFDYILVDGSHDKKDARHDLGMAAKLLASDGILVFDDISPHGCDLLDVWESFKQEWGGILECHENMKGKGVGWAISI